MGPAYLWSNIWRDGDWIRIYQNDPHKHFDMYEDGSIYVYEHKHGETVNTKERHKVTPWVMFIIFLLGPCEPMIPLMYFPAAKNSWLGMVIADHRLYIIYASHYDCYGNIRLWWHRISKTGKFRTLCSRTGWFNSFYLRRVEWYLLDGDEM